MSLGESVGKELVSKDIFPGEMSPRQTNEKGRIQTNTRDCATFKFK